MIFGYFTLAVALVISAVAAYYSIVGLTAIFAAAVIPIIIMGAALEVGKITAAVWLKLNWHRARFTYKLYLVPAVAFLMLLTSMGIFGFLSKAHTDQALVSGDVQSKIAVYDERIKTERDNVEMARRALAQMDAQVEARLNRGDSEAGAERAVQIRRQQAAERNRLLKEIADSQKKIAKLNEEAAPIRAEVRKVEAEVGPIKYIAALIYGDDADTTLLEAAVRWVIIIIVAVFDPLALVLILAAQQSIRWAREEKVNKIVDDSQPEEQVVVSTETIIKNEPTVPPAEEFDISKHAYLNQGFGKPHPPGVEPAKPLVWIPERSAKSKSVKIKKPNKKKTSIIEKINVETPNTDDVKIETVPESEPIPIKVPELKKPNYTDLGNGYFDIDGKMVHSRVIRDLYPDVYADLESKKIQATLAIRADNEPELGIKSKASFGTQFPDQPQKGDMFLHVGTLPSRLFKFNGGSWIQVDKSVADSYTYDEDYLKYLVDNITKGIISAEDLTVSEQDQIEQYLKKNA